MNKKVIIDLNGVVFEPVDRNFTKIARSKYGYVKGSAVALAYKFRIGHGLMQDSVASVLFACAKNPVVRNGALDALEQISRLPDTTIEFCGQVAFPGQHVVLEKKYRAIAPCMDAAAHYELVSPYLSKRGYLHDSTAADKDTMNYIVGTHSDDLNWPARWRIVPILIDGSAENVAAIHRNCVPRCFETLTAFKDYLARRR